MSTEEQQVLKQEDEEEENESIESEEEEEQEECERVPIDLSENEVYRGVCTLLEDEDGNNIVEYISLLHTELIGINKSLENLRLMRKDLTRLADCAELFFKAKRGDVSGEDIKKKVKK